MPLFSNKFSSKKNPQRKTETAFLSRECRNTSNELIDQDQIQFKLGNRKVMFDRGHWISDDEDVNIYKQESLKLQQSLKDLQQKNNMLNVKVEILLDMLAECNVELHLKERELKKITI